MRSRPTAEPPGRRHPVKPFGETGPGGKSPAQIPVCRILYCNPVCTGTRAGVFFWSRWGNSRTAADGSQNAGESGQARPEWQRAEGVFLRPGAAAMAAHWSRLPSKERLGGPSPPEEGPGLPFLRPGKSLTPRTGGRRERRGGRQRRGEAKASGAVRARGPPRLRRRGNTAYRTRAARGQRRA